MDDGGSVASSGHLSVDGGVRAAGAGEVGDGFSVVCGECRCGCERGGWVAVAETVSRVDCWGDLAELAGDSLGEG